MFNQEKLLQNERQRRFEQKSIEKEKLSKPSFPKESKSKRKTVRER